MLLGQPDVPSFGTGLRQAQPKQGYSAAVRAGCIPSGSHLCILLLTHIPTKTNNSLVRSVATSLSLKKKKKVAVNWSPVCCGHMEYNYLVLFISFQNNIIGLPLHLLCLHLLLLSIFKNNKLKFRAGTSFEWIVSWNNFSDL